MAESSQKKLQNTTINPLKCQSHKMVKHTQAIRQQQLTNCLSVFDHFLKLVHKGLICPVTTYSGPILIHFVVKLLPIV